MTVTFTNGPNCIIHLELLASLKSISSDFDVLLRLIIDIGFSINRVFKAFIEEDLMQILIMDC